MRAILDADLAGNIVDFLDNFRHLLCYRPHLHRLDFGEVGEPCDGSTRDDEHVTGDDRLDVHRRVHVLPLQKDLRFRQENSTEIHTNYQSFFSLIHHLTHSRALLHPSTLLSDRH